LVPDNIVLSGPALTTGKGFTVTDKVNGKAHCPLLGVKVYVLELALLMELGDQEPAILLAELLGNTGTLAPLQTDRLLPKLNVGVILGFTVTERLRVVAHCPLLGVNVYVPDAILLIVAGDQVPAILLAELDGNTGTLAPLQTDKLLPKLNVGTILGFKVTESICVLAHCPLLGVKV
jgi:uncharacterized membrane protein (Fun14 family)